MARGVPINQVRGMLLEEAILYLLRHAGYRTVTTPGTDPTLSGRLGFMQVKGRGEDHQIDAIADFSVVPPFAYPFRLLVEAKCYDDSVGIDIVRNAVGVMKDLTEYWLGQDVTALARNRYTYRYAIFSATSFSKNAQRYAFAQDIYLFPLSESRFFRSVLDAIAAVTRQELEQCESASEPVSVLKLREKVRRDLGDGHTQGDHPLSTLLDDFYRACGRIDNTLLGVLPGGFVVFLVPAGADVIGRLDDVTPVKLMRDIDGGRGFYISNSYSGEELFSFDAPEPLFSAYAKDGFLTDEAGLRIKGQQMHRIQAFWVHNERRPRILTFELDENWCREVGIHGHNPE